MKEPYSGHSQTNKLIESFKVPPEFMPRLNPPSGLYPDRLRATPKRRLMAFRVPEDYAYDAIRGYQGDAETFNCFRIRLGLIPSDAKLVWMVFEHPKHNCYVIVEHPSFPEYTPGTDCPLIKIELEEFGVSKNGTMGTRDISDNGSQPQRLVRAERRSDLAGSSPAVPTKPQKWEEELRLQMGAIELLQRVRARAKGVKL